MMAKFILSERSRALLKFSRRNLIESTSSSSDTDVHHYDTFKLIDNKNNLIQVSAHARLKRLLSYFEDNSIDDNDRDLLKGVFMRNPHADMELSPDIVSPSPHKTEDLRSQISIQNIS